MKIKYFLLPWSFTAFMACNQSPTEQQSNEEETKSTSCTYSFDALNTKVNWTAFKTTDKVGVGGQFDSFEFAGTVEGETPEAVFTNAGISIETASVNTANPDRDKKILNHFFGTMVSSESISGFVKSMSEGKAVLSLKLNEVESDLAADYQLVGDTVKVNGVIDLSNWEALASRDSLNQVCYDLHKGTDGESKLWPDVEIEIISVLRKKCE